MRVHTRTYTVADVKTLDLKRTGEKKKGDCRAVTFHRWLLGWAPFSGCTLSHHHNNIHHHHQWSFRQKASNSGHLQPSPLVCFVVESCPSSFFLLCTTCKHVLTGYVLLQRQTSFGTTLINNVSETEAHNNNQATIQSATRVMLGCVWDCLHNIQMFCRANYTFISKPD